MIVQTMACTEMALEEEIADSNYRIDLHRQRADYLRDQADQFRKLSALAGTRTSPTPENQRNSYLDETTIESFGNIKSHMLDDLPELKAIKSEAHDMDPGQLVDRLMTHGKDFESKRDSLTTEALSELHLVILLSKRIEGIYLWRLQAPNEYTATSLTEYWGHLEKSIVAEKCYPRGLISKIARWRSA